MQRSLNLTNIHAILCQKNLALQDHQGRGHGVPGGENMIKFSDGSVRYLTTFEAKRIQTFPDDFVIKGAWGEAMRKIGNAVPVLLAQKIGSELAQKNYDEQ
jgi:site-specific DNA-cytosine methylase